MKEDLLKVVNIFLFQLFFSFQKGGKEERREIHECTYIYIIVSVLAVAEYAKTLLASSADTVLGLQLVSVLGLYANNL